MGVIQNIKEELIEEVIDEGNIIDQSEIDALLQGNLKKAQAMINDVLNRDETSEEEDEQPVSIDDEYDLCIDDEEWLIDDFEAEVCSSKEEIDFLPKPFPKVMPTPDRIKKYCLYALYEEGIRFIKSRKWANAKESFEYLIECMKDGENYGELKVDVRIGLLLSEIKVPSRKDLKDRIVNMDDTNDELYRNTEHFMMVRYPELRYFFDIWERRRRMRLKNIKEET